MTGTAQLPLELAPRPALGREDFLVAPSNEVAVAWIDRWPDWPGPALALYGPPGSGKTHLCQVWRAASGAVEIDGSRLAEAEPPELLGAARTCVLDDADAVLAGAGMAGGMAGAARVAVNTGAMAAITTPWRLAAPSKRQAMAAAHHRAMATTPPAPTRPSTRSPIR